MQILKLYQDVLYLKKLWRHSVCSHLWNAFRSSVKIGVNWRILGKCVPSKPGEIWCFVYGNLRIMLLLYGFKSVVMFVANKCLFYLGCTSRFVFTNRNENHFKSCLNHCRHENNQIKCWVPPRAGAKRRNLIVVCFVRFRVVYLKNSLFLYAEVNKIKL